MKYQPSWAIYCQSHPCRKTKEELFNPWGDKVVHNFPKGISPKVNVTGQLEFRLTSSEAAV